MVGIRNKKKEKIKADILEAAKHLFIEEGYDKVSMNKIAEKAMVGTGTIYNYYKNKSEVFIAAIKENVIDEEDTDFLKDLDLNSNVDISILIVKFMEQYFNKYKWMFKKNIMQSFVKAVFSFASGKNSLMNSLIAEDFKFIDAVESFLIKLKKLDLFDMDARNTAELIYSAAVYEIMMYLYSDTSSIEEAKEKIIKKVQIIIN